MKKMLLALFIVLILSFGIVGYSQSTADQNEVIADSQSLTIHSTM